MFNVGEFEWKHTFSMRVPLFVMLLLIGILPMVLQGKILIGSFKQNQIDSRIAEVQNQCLILSGKMSRSGYMDAETRDPILDSELGGLADVFNGRIVVVDKNFKIIRDTFNLAENKTNISQEVIRCFQGENLNRYYKDKHYLSQVIPIYNAVKENQIDGVMVMTASTENQILLAEMVEDKTSFFQITTFLIVAILALVAVQIFIQPFRNLQKVLNQVANGDLDADIAEDTYRETSEISSAVNITLEKLKAVDRSRQEFVSNVSHELKTPITSIRVLADSLMSMEDAPVDLYREFMIDISDEIDRESKIIDDLLTLVKMDKSATEMNIEQVDINALMELILKRLRPIAKKRNVELTLESIREVTADVDEVKLSLALSNLVENAVKYNVTGGWVRVTLDADHKFFYVKVADSGIGIPEDCLERIFERFYRVDKARSRETGGTGLGLAITKNVILMHQGAVKVQSKDGEGTTFTVRIPLNYIS